jgi:hypothetical protein
MVELLLGGAMQADVVGRPERGERFGSRRQLTDEVYENPATGAVLAQIWKTGPDSITAIYQPATSRDTMPANPYAG